MSIQCVLALVAVLHVVPGLAQDDPDFSDVDPLLASGQLGPITSLLIQHRERLLHESYYHGANSGQLQDLYSLTKSIGATLIGMAERRGLLSSDDPVPSLFPQYPWQSAPFSNHAQLHLRDALSMRHGVLWDEWTHGVNDPRNTYNRMIHSADWYRFVFSQPRVAPPDSGFTYNTGMSQLMSGSLRQVSGLSPEQVFVQWLAQPLGIHHHEWVLKFEPPFDDGIREFPFNDVPLGVGLRLRPRDLLPIGVLYLNRGLFNGQRLLDEDWIDRAWTRYSNGDNDTYFRNEPEATGYGFQWWFVELLDARDRKIGCWYGAGAGRQYLLVCPSVDLVVVSTSHLAGYDGPGIFTLMRSRILPAFELVPDPPPQLTGLWFDPARSGQGFNLQATAGGLFGYYYGYDDGQPLWLLLDVHADPVELGQSIVLEALAPVQGTFGAPVDPGQGGMTAWGTLTIRFDSCTRAQARLEGLSGDQDFELEMLAGVDGFDFDNCSAPAAPRPMADATGAWFDPSTSGQGWNFLQTPAGMIGYFYGYDQAGNPLWLLTETLSPIEPGMVHHIDLLSGQGGTFTTPVPPGELQHWGTLELELFDCRSGIAVIDGFDGHQFQQLQMLAAVPDIPGCTQPESASVAP